MSLRENLKILVVDDMSTSRALITQALEAIGIHNVMATSDVEKATRTLASNPAHLVVCDYNMPGSNGLDFLQVLRENGPTADIAFILISGQSDATILARGQHLGMNNFIPKPFDVHSLKAAIEAVVGRL